MGSPKLLTLLLLFASLQNGNAAISCNTSQTCEELLYPGSECSSENYCSNPYTKGGCLANRVPGWKKIRLCNSDDAPNAASLGHCREPYPGLEYTEVRLASQNWESAFFIAWIQQIILSELVDVPVSLEPGQANTKISFYDENNTLDSGVSYPWDGLETARDIKDCRKVNNNESGSNYTQCVHVISEVWHNSWVTLLDDLEGNGIIEPLQFMGVFSKSGWYVPRFTAERDPTLLSHLGLAGEENRRKLAETFLSPTTTWSQYCNEVSPDNCRTPNNVSARAPIDYETEGVMYFSEGLYAGHFRATAENDCDMNPTTCHGHFADWPCGWNSVFQVQAFHNNIALNTSGDEPFGSGYTYERLVEVWHAANATKSNVIQHWWQPEALHQLFFGTDAEFQKVALPPATLECLESRVDVYQNRCKGDIVGEQGSPEGACDDPEQALMKVISTAFFDETYDPSIPEAIRSPAYDVVKGFNIDTLQLDQIFALWLNRNLDRYGFDPRDATCQWVADNLEFIQSFIPPTYPRAVREDQKFDPVRYISLSLGIFAVILVCLSFLVAYRKRQKTVIRYAQLDFMFLLLSGLLLISIAAVISAISNSNPACISVAWLINVGYTLKLVPLIIKVFAVIRLMQAAKKFRRVELTRRSLFGEVLVLTCFTLIFMIIWTVLDPPQIVPQYLLTDEITDAGETIVSVSYYCRSNSDVWSLISLSVQGFLLLVTSVLAFQMRNIRQELNESLSLAIMVYSDFIFWGLRLISFLWFEKSDFASAVPGIYSLILGIDSIASICIYFLPKFFSKERMTRRATTYESSLSRQRETTLPANGVASNMNYQDCLSKAIHPPSDETILLANGVTSHMGYQDDSSKDIRPPADEMTEPLNSVNRRTVHESQRNIRHRLVRSRSLDSLLQPN